MTDPRQSTMFDTWQPAPPRAWFEPVDGHGHVIQGQADETLELPHPRLAWSLARIELHRHSDGRWMWSASLAGGGYKVGPKWGKFAENRAGALHYAAAELLAGLDRVRDPESVFVSAAHLKQVRAWAQGLKP